MRVSSNNLVDIGLILKHRNASKKPLLLLQLRNFSVQLSYNVPNKAQGNKLVPCTSWHQLELSPTGTRELVLQDGLNTAISFIFLGRKVM